MPEERELTRWVVQYRAAGRGANVETWAVIYLVPAVFKQADMQSALEDWPRWSEWQSRVGIGGRVTLTPEAKWSESIRTDVAAAELEEKEGVPTRDRKWHTVWLPWSSFAPVERRVTVAVDGRLHARMTRDATSRGITLGEWARNAYEAALAGGGE